MYYSIADSRFTTDIKLSVIHKLLHHGSTPSQLKADPHCNVYDRHHPVTGRMTDVIWMICMQSAAAIFDSVVSRSTRTAYDTEYEMGRFPTIRVE